MACKRNNFIVCLLVVVLMVFLADADKEPYNCDEIFDKPEGDIYSPFYKNGKYPEGLDCKYQIRVPTGLNVKLTFKDVDIRPYSACSEDRLSIIVDDIRPIGVICGTAKPEPVIITNPKANIILNFITERMSARRGFHVHYKISTANEYCSPGLKKCLNRKCFNETSQKCNGFDDCGDGTDEENCNLPLARSECGKPPISPDIDVEEKGRDRIVGGKEAVPGSWPWQASLQTGYIKHDFAPILEILHTHFCGGTLINAQWVVSAAHCIHSDLTEKSIRIHLGKHHTYFKDPYEQIRYNERVIVWPNKTGELIDGEFEATHDIALIKLNAPVQFTKAVRPACFPRQGLELKVGKRCYTTGWGETRGTGSDDVLKQMDLSILPKSECFVAGYFEEFNENTTICVKNEKGFQSPCHGDSGGPLVCKLEHKWYLMGATSGGIYDTFDGTSLCAMPEDRGMFSKVSAHADWVYSMINKYS